MLLLAALGLLLLGATSPPSAGVDDGAHLFTAAALTQAAQAIQQIGRQTNRGVAVVTVPSLDGQAIEQAAAATLKQRRVDVLIYISQADRALAVEVGPDARQAITPPEMTAIRDQMLDQFGQGNYDLGLLGGIERVGADLRTAPAPPGGFAGTTAQETVFLLAGAIVLAAFLTILANPRAFRTRAGRFLGSRRPVAGQEEANLREAIERIPPEGPEPPEEPSD
ncbi:MAG TPA: TPM domain-containing protein [Thermomicrobiaceae bacterium]|nr:TPM domain-containing protein [Thermomicrobiaceae bacterium]